MGISEERFVKKEKNTFFFFLLCYLSLLDCNKSWLDFLFKDQFKHTDFSAIIQHEVHP